MPGMYMDTEILKDVEPGSIVYQGISQGMGKKLEITKSQVNTMLLYVL